MTALLLALCLTALAQDPETDGAEEAPTEVVEEAEAPAEEAPAEEAPAEEAPAEEAEEAPIEEGSAEEAPVEEVPAEEDGWEEAEASEEPAVEETEGEEAVAEGEEEKSPGYTAGFLAGEEDAKRANDYALHGLAGFGAGCIVGPCGCVAVPAIEAVVVPGVPAGPWQGFDEEYKQGYIDGYRKKVQRRRILYSLAGASVGTVLGVGTGLAFGVFIS